MSSPPPDDGETTPPTSPPTPPGGAVPKPPRGGYMPLAVGLGLVFLYLAGLSMLPAIGPVGPYGAPLSLAVTYWGLFIAYVVVAVVLAVWRRTSQTGAGMLIAFGIWLLLGGELCVGILFNMRGTV